MSIRMSASPAPRVMAKSSAAGKQRGLSQWRDFRYTKHLCEGQVQRRRRCNSARNEASAPQGAGVDDPGVAIRRSFVGPAVVVRHMPSSLGMA